MSESISSRPSVVLAKSLIPHIMGCHVSAHPSLERVVIEGSKMIITAMASQEVCDLLRGWSIIVHVCSNANHHFIRIELSHPHL